MVRQATETAVSASISTPVGPETFTSAVTRTPGSASSIMQSTATFDRRRGWQSGISSCVRFAAMMPASRAVPSTSPFLASPLRIRATVSGAVTTRPSARAVRAVTAFSETSTMLAAPVRSRWVSGATGLSEEQAPCRLRHVGLAHQALAHEKRADPGAREALHLGVRDDAALADRDPVRRHPRRQRLADRKRGLEGAEIPVVDADEPRAKGKRALELARVVHLDEHVHPELARCLGERPRLLVRDARHDDEDAVRAPGPRLK